MARNGKVTRVKKNLAKKSKALPSRWASAGKGWEGIPSPCLAAPDQRASARTLYVPVEDVFEEFLFAAALLGFADFVGNLRQILQR